MHSAVSKLMKCLHPTMLKKKQTRNTSGDNCFPLCLASNIESEVLLACVFVFSNILVRCCEACGFGGGAVFFSE